MKSHLSTAFDAVRSEHIHACRVILSKQKSEILSEAAFPAYSHANPIINHLFWDRLRRAVEYMESLGALNTILDFGCGGCPMAHFASRAAARVVAADIQLGPARAVAELVPLPANVELLDLQLESLSGLPPNSVDLILALDVLEHVSDLESTLGEFHRLLTQRGRVLVSGPTESFLYKIGRRLAGPEYTGDYHVRNADDIREAMTRKWKVQNLSSVYRWLPLFDLFAGCRIADNT